MAETENEPGHPRLRVTDIGEFVRVRSCARRLNLSYSNAARRLPFYGRLHNPIDPVLQRSGRQREDEFAKYLEQLGFREVEPREDDPGVSFTQFLEAIRQGDNPQPVYGREVTVEATLGAFIVNGRIDFICFDSRADVPRLLVIETKASRKDKTYHRIQLATYKLIVESMTRDLVIANRAGLPVDCYVARIDEGTNEIQRALDLPPLELTTEPDDVLALLSPTGGLLEIIRADVEDLPFSIDAKCDACAFAIHCLPEAARLRKIELLSLDTGLARILRRNGIDTLSDLVRLDLDGAVTRAIKSDPSFSADLSDLRVQAAARLRTLPALDQPADQYSPEEDDQFASELEQLFADRDFFSSLYLNDAQWRWTVDVRHRSTANQLDAAIRDRLTALRFPWRSQVERLPTVSATQIVPRIIDGVPTVRIFMTVHYDYVENRIGAISAHVTNSTGRVFTPFRTELVDGVEKHVPDPVVREIPQDGNEDALEELQGEDVIEYRPAPWPEDATASTATEGALLEAFFHKLLVAVADIAVGDHVIVHFYTWSRSEISQLIEACSRSSPVALATLRELLGCREPLEQLIFTCLQDEVDRRFAIGWTGRGLSVVSTLSWGRAYHWNRQVGRETKALDTVFNQDIFDFKTTLDVADDGRWTAPGAPGSHRETFEIRSRFYDSLSAPYWRALWGTLRSPDEPGIQAQERNQLERYYGAASGALLREYLRARSHCLRWVSDHFPENSDIRKEPIPVQELRQFRLGVNDACRAALDFLRLEQHVRVQTWISRCLIPPAARVAAGKALPVRNLREIGPNTLEADLDFDRYEVDVEAFLAKANFEAGSPYRVSRCFQDPRRGQTIPMLTRAGFTGFLDAIDFDAGRLTIRCVPSRQSTYALPSFVPDEQFDYAVLDEGVTDFVASKVEDRLLAAQNSPAVRWFDPTDPMIPEYAGVEEATIAGLKQQLSQLRNANDDAYDDEQIDAIADGLASRIQLLQGPPGTGKTTTTAMSVLCRLAVRAAGGDRVIIAGPTHRAVNTLLRRIARELESIRERGIEILGRDLHEVVVYRVDRRDTDEPIGHGVVDATSSRTQPFETAARGGEIQVLGVTTNSLMKLAQAVRFRAREPAEIVLDEASMMVFPHFLAIASLAGPDTRIMIVGDHRQLAPIVAHDWEQEDRPPVIAYQPYVSAFEAIRRLLAHPSVHGNRAMIRWSQLSYTFRLPEEVRRLIAPVYERDALQLRGRVDPIPERELGGDPLAQVWTGRPGIYLIVHDESTSTTSNEVETRILQLIMERSGELADDSVAVVTPHRAQRTMLTAALEGYRRQIGVIDTVEKLQGGERPVVILSATVSDPAVIARRAEFVLSLERANVAFSRCQEKLVVVCSHSLLSSVPDELEHYEASILWKMLRRICVEQIGEVNVDGFRVEVLAAGRNGEAE